MDELIFESPEVLVYKVKLLKDNNFQDSTISRVTGLSEEMVKYILNTK